MPETTSTALPSFSHDQFHETDAAKRKGESYRRTTYFTTRLLYCGLNK